MSIAAQCPDCCTCPTPTTQWDSRSATLRKRGWQRYDGVVGDIYLTITGSGSTSRGAATLAISGSTTVDPITRLLTGSVTQSGCDTFDVSTDYSPSFTLTDGALWPAALDEARGPGYMASGDEDNYMNSVVEQCSGCMSFEQIVDQDGISSSQTATTQTSTGTGVPLSTFCGTVTYTGSRVFTLSDLYTTAALITNATAALPFYPGTWAGTPGSFRNVSTDELSVALREDRYRLRFPVPLVGSGVCYRPEWVERFIAEAGVALTSAEIVTRGVYRPTVSSSGGGGSGLQLVAVMSSAGAVTSIRILNPGSGYTSAPTITVQSAINGGTTSTGWTATVTGGQVTAVAGGSGGNYLPTGAFSGGGGSGATITFTMDETGGLATSPLGSGGSGYTVVPTLTITPKVSGSTAARVDLHLGTETARCAAWDGTTLGGKWVVREIVDAGHALASLEVVHGGEYLPIVTFTGGGGTGAAAYVSGFSTTGAVTAITVIAGGSGYTSAPTVVITRRGSGGSVTAATATASITGDAVTSVAVTTGGAYLPTLAITGGGGTGATATVAFDSGNLGTLATATLTAPGSGFLSNPTLTLSYYGTEEILLAAHFGTETEYTDGTQPPGAIPLGYVASASRTWPILGDTGTAPWKYFELPVPSAYGTTLVANVRAYCDCSDCP